VSQLKKEGFASRLFKIPMEAMKCKTSRWFSIAVWGYTPVNRMIESKFISRIHIPKNCQIFTTGCAARNQKA
jgi:hypothetical protein